MKYWLSLLEKEKVTCSLPNLENEGQWSVNDRMPCIIVNHSTMSLLLSIYIVSTAFVGHWTEERLVVA
jgi:hypothetical protein